MDRLEPHSIVRQLVLVDLVPVTLAKSDVKEGLRRMAHCAHLRNAIRMFPKNASIILEKIDGNPAWADYLAQEIMSIQGTIAWIVRNPNPRPASGFREPILGTQPLKPLFDSNLRNRANSRKRHNPGHVEQLGEENRFEGYVRVQDADGTITMIHPSNMAPARGSKRPVLTRRPRL